MGYSARRGFTNGKASGAQRQMEMQQKIAQMQEDMNARQAEIEAREFSASVGGGVVVSRFCQKFCGGVYPIAGDEIYPVCRKSF